MANRITLSTAAFRLFPRLRFSPGRQSSNNGVLMHHTREILGRTPHAKPGTCAPMIRKSPPASKSWQPGAIPQYLEP
jgi:hypothetical protein